MASLATRAGPLKFAPFIGGALSSGAGFAFGAATSPTLRPILQDLENATWKAHQSRPLDAGVAAGIVAEDVEQRGWGANEAAQHGINGERFDALLGEALNAPGLAELLTLWRRGRINADDFTHGLRKMKLEPRWDAAIKALYANRLAPNQIALGIVRSLMADPNFLPVTLDTSGGKVPSYGVSAIDPLAEAEAAGIDRERLRIMVGEIGQPMALASAASAVFRGIIARADFNRAVLEGDTRPEWADAIFENARQIPTSRDFFENALRGYHDFEWALEQAKRHGMSEADATIIYQNQGRPMAIRQITQALSRGAKFNPEPGELKDPYDAAVVEGNVKPAYYELAKALRYTLPSPFVMRQLTASGVWSEAKAAQRLKDSGWIPQDANEAAAAWAGGTGKTADPHVAKAQTSLYNTTRTAYLAGDATDAVARAKLPQAGVTAAAVDDVLALWKHEREIQRQRLTPAQVKSAWKRAVMNEATGSPWSYDDALAELLSRGWSHLDATTFLAITPTPKSG